MCWASALACFQTAGERLVCAGRGVPCRPVGPPGVPFRLRCCPSREPWVLVTMEGLLEDQAPWLRCAEASRTGGRMKQRLLPPWLQPHEGCDRSGGVRPPHPTGPSWASMRTRPGPLWSRRALATVKMRPGGVQQTGHTINPARCSGNLGPFPGPALLLPAEGSGF